MSVDIERAAFLRGIEALGDAPCGTPGTKLRPGSQRKEPNLKTTAMTLAVLLAFGGILTGTSARAATDLEKFQ